MDRVLFLGFSDSEVFKDTSFILDTGLVLPLNTISLSLLPALF